MPLSRGFLPHEPQAHEAISYGDIEQFSYNEYFIFNSRKLAPGEKAWELCVCQRSADLESFFQGDMFAKVAKNLESEIRNNIRFFKAPVKYASDRSWGEFAS